MVTKGIFNEILSFVVVFPTKLRSVFTACFTFSDLKHELYYFSKFQRHLNLAYTDGVDCGCGHIISSIRKSLASDFNVTTFNYFG